MKVFICKASGEMSYPVLSVIVARDEQEAYRILETAQAINSFMKEDRTGLYELKEIDLSEQQAIILTDWES